MALLRLGSTAAAVLEWYHSVSVALRRVLPWRLFAVVLRQVLPWRVLAWCCSGAAALP